MLRALVAVAVLLGLSGAMSGRSMAATFTAQCGESGVPVYPQSVIDDDPLGYWRLCGDGRPWVDSWPGSRDSSGNGYLLKDTKDTGCCFPLQYQQAGALSESNYGTGYAGGKSNYSTLQSQDFAFPAAFTVEAWYQPDVSRSGEDGGALKDDLVTSGAAGGWELGWGGGHNGFVMRQETSYNQSGCGCYTYDHAAVSYPITAGQWYHLVGTWNGSELRLYVNGLLVARTVSTKSWRPDPAEMSIGYGMYGGDGWPLSRGGSTEGAHGTLDEIAVYDHAISYERVRAHYAASGRTPPPPSYPKLSETFGSGSAASPNRPNCHTPDPVNCATGNLTDSISDIDVGGRGLPLELIRTYNSQAARVASSPGVVGYGWSLSFTDSLEIDPVQQTATVHAADGSTVSFTSNGDGTHYFAEPWVQATLLHNGDGSYTYTLPDLTASVFDSTGKLISQSDRNGNQTTLSYNNGQLVTITGASGRTIALSYNADGTLQAATDPENNSVQYSYRNGELVGVTDRAGHQTAYAYDASHQLTSTTDPRGGAVSEVYDSNGRVTSQTDQLGHQTTWEWLPDGVRITDPAGHVTEERFERNMPVSITKGYGTASAATTTIAYDDENNPISVTGPDGHVWTYGYDAAGNVTRITDPLDHTTTFSYDANRQVTSTTMPSGALTSFGYDARHNLTSVTRTLSETNTPVQTSFGYDADGQLTSATDPLNHVWSYGYDAVGDLISTTSPLGSISTTSYDADGRPQSTVSPIGNRAGADPAQYTTRIAVDELGRPTAITDPLGHESRYSYDANGNLTDQTDADGRHIHYRYDAANRLTQTDRPDGQSFSSSYTDDGKLASQTDAAGHATSYHYDPLGRLDQVEDPEQRTTTYAWTAADRLGLVTNPDGTTVDHSYDQAGRLTGIDYSDDTPDVSLAYDADGQLISAQDANGTTSRGYDSLGRLTSVTDPAGSSVSYGYDLAGRLTSINYPGSGRVLQRAYDGDDRLTSLTDWDGHTIQFGYDANSRLTDTTYPAPSSLLDSYTYDRSGQLTNITMADASAVLAAFGYDRSPGGLITAEHGGGSQINSVDHSYSYDENGWLAGADSTTYGYDAAGDLTDLDNASGATHDASRALTALTAGGETLSYTLDARGRRASVKRNSQLELDPDYDAANRLTRVAFGDGSDPVSYGYDADGLRISRTRSETTTHYSWDRNSDLPLLLDDGSHSLIYGPGDQPVEQLGDDGTVRYLHTDQLGSVRALSALDGSTVGRTDYLPYGGVAATSGEKSALGYAGQLTDPATGLIYLRARDYDPTTGSLLTRDPLEAATGDPYGYAANNPLSNTDPSGLISWNDALGFTSNAAAGALDGATGGLSTKLAAAIIGFNADCADFGPGFGIGQGIGIIGSAADGIAEVGAATRAGTTAAKAGSGAESALAGKLLGRQLASEEQVAGAGTRIVGPGTGRELRAGPRLGREYGGAPGDWVKMSSGHYDDGLGTYDLFETHWYENVRTGARHEFKTKFPRAENAFGGE